MESYGVALWISGVTVGFLLESVTCTTQPPPWLVEQFTIIFCTDILIYSLLICRFVGVQCTAFSY